MDKLAFEKVPRPKTKGEAVRQVAEIYEQNDWGRVERMTHQTSLGLEPKLVTLFTVDELRVILDDFERARMILYSEPKARRYRA